MHLCLNGPFNDGWGYQDNLLPKYQAKKHDVVVIAQNRHHTQNGIEICECCDIKSVDGFRLIRVPQKEFKLKRLGRFFKDYDIYNLLREISPELIMVHGVSGSLAIYQVVRYKKRINRECIIIEDNHLDYYNCGENSLGNRLFRFFRKNITNRYTQKYAECVFGTTPWRIEYANKCLGIRKEKLKLLVTGGDDDKIHFDDRIKIKKSICSELNINEDDFIIVTGGKIDRTKNIHLLMRAVKELNGKNIKLIVFGQTDNEMNEEINQLSADDSIRFIGWIPAEEAYNYFLTSDLAVFPGTHSVLWEQLCACGIPALFKSWDGMHHVCVNGNSDFLYNDSVEEIKAKISEIYDNPEVYERMKSAAENCKREFFYSQIARNAVIVN